MDGHKPDIVLVAEHKLNPRHRLEFEGYVVHRQNRDEGTGGGTAIFVRDSIGHDRAVLNLGNIENTCVRIRRRDGSTLTLVAMYLRPQEQLDIVV